MRIFNYDKLHTATKKALDLLLEYECRILEMLRSEYVSDLNLWLINIDAQEFEQWFEDAEDGDCDDDDYLRTIAQLREAFALLKSAYGEGVFLLEWT